jgi:hypothetical protein
MHTADMPVGGTEHGGGGRRVDGGPWSPNRVPSSNVRRPQCIVDAERGRACYGVRVRDCGSCGCASGGGEREETPEKEDTHATAIQNQENSIEHEHENSTETELHSHENSTETEPNSHENSTETELYSTGTELHSAETELHSTETELQNQKCKETVTKRERKVTFAEQVRQPPPPQVREARVYQVHLKHSINQHEKAVSELVELAKRVGEYRQDHLDSIAQCEAVQTDCEVQTWALHHEAAARGKHHVGPTEAKAEAAAAESKMCKAHQALRRLEKPRRKLANAIERVQMNLKCLQRQESQMKGILAMHNRVGSKIKAGEEGEELIRASLNPHATLEEAATRFNNGEADLACEPGMLQIQFDMDDDETADALRMMGPKAEAQEGAVVVAKL